MTDEQLEKEMCPMCGADNSAKLDQPNGGWTQIECNQCGGGVFYLWIRAEKPCTRSLKILNN